MTGHLGYESTGLNALRGQNNVQGLNDSGANPSYLPGYQPVDDPEIRREVLGGVGRRGARGARATGSTRSSRGSTTGASKALYLVGENPAQTEPNAHHVEEGLERCEFIVSQDIFLNDSTRKYADVVLPASSFAEKDGTFTNTERRVNRVRKALDCPGEAREDWRIVCDLARALGASWPEYRTPEDVWNESPTSAPNWYGIRYDRLEENGHAVAVHRPRPPGHAVPARAAAGAAERRGGSSRSSTSRRSSSPTRSTRSCSRPAGRSTTTTRRR